jgi:hypothetical protein
MSLQMFQRAVVELTLAPGKARLLRDGDVSMLAGFELTALERERLDGIVRQPGISVSCSLSRGNRLEIIFQMFPMTCTLLMPVLRQLMDEIWENNRPTNYQLTGEETAFIEIVQRKIAAGALSIPYLEEVFGYELACMELTHRLRDEADPDAVVVVDFAHSPDELLPPLSQLKGPPAGLPEGAYRVRVRMDGERFRFEVL